MLQAPEPWSFSDLEEFTDLKPGGQVSWEGHN